jgi:hypothetical protein
LIESVQVWLSLYTRDNEKVQHPLHPLAPAWAVLNSQHLKVLKQFLGETVSICSYHESMQVANNFFTNIHFPALIVEQKFLF